MRLQLPKDDPKASAAYDDIPATSVHDTKGAQRLGELRLVARAWMFWQRPRHIGERNPKRVRRPFDRQRRRDRSL
jgi:hypothetical protein